MKRVLCGVIILLLTALSQVGGVIYAIALLVRSRVPFARTRVGLAALFVGLYALAWFPIERAAAVGGRVGLPCVERGGLSASVVSCALHRHYATPDLAEIVAALAGDVDARFDGTVTRALDANFPLFDGVPLPPHLSHDDGEKIDLAFYYVRDGIYQSGALGSPLGYWKFERPRAGEQDACGASAGPLRWDMTWFAPSTRSELMLDEARTRFALNWLARDGARRGVGKVFLEPHLAERMRVSGDVIRFQGCHAARHDDHIHLQLR
jgi:hypothetical protein